MAANQGVQRGFPDMKNRRLKEQAVAFYSQHDVTGALERLLNEMFPAAPSDVYGYMSEYFNGLSKEPLISTLSSQEVFDPSGGRAMEIQLHCTINGVEKPVSSARMPLELFPEEPMPLATTPPSKGDKKGKGSKSNLQKTPEKTTSGTELESTPSSTSSGSLFVDAFESVSKHIAPAVRGLSPKKQSEIDEALTHLEDGDRKLHPSALLSVSTAVATAGSTLLKTPLYNHLISTCCPHIQKLTMPIPVVSIIGGGHTGCGKLRFREFCLTPLPGSTFPEQTKALATIYLELGRVLATKLGPSSQGTLISSGAYCPAVDKPEQALDLLQEAATRAGYQLNTDVGVIIDVGAEKLYDQDKGKYEVVAGQWKTSDDLVNMYSDLLQSHPGVLGFVDPLHNEDIGGWLKLHEKLGSKCLLVADRTLKAGLDVRPKQECQTSSEFDQSDSKEQQEVGTCQEDTTTAEEALGISYLSCSTLTPDSTLSECAEKATHLKGHSYYIMLRVPPSLAVNSLVADLAVALQCRFLRLGAPIGFTSSTVLSRLLCIREELITRKLHEPAKAHLFTCVPLSEEQVATAEAK